MNRKARNRNRSRATAPLLVVALSIVFGLLAFLPSTAAWADEQTVSDMSLQPQGAYADSGTSGDCSWGITSAGVLEIKPSNGVSGTLSGITYDSNALDSTAPWAKDAKYIKSVKVTGTVFTSSNEGAALFADFFQMTSCDISGLDTSRSTNLDDMFLNCASLTSIDLSRMSTQGASSMANFFAGCDSLTSVTVGSSFKFSNGSSTLCTLPALELPYSGNWKSSKTGVTYPASTIEASRSGIADTYTAMSDTRPVYRLLYVSTNEHLFTTDVNEVRTLVGALGWTYEGVAWFAPVDGSPVYRLFQPSLGLHHYTSDTYEISVITSQQGWKVDFDGVASFNSGGNVAIYRLFNRYSGQHLFTTDMNEYNTLPGEGWGWVQEGVSLHCFATGDLSYPYPGA